MSGRDAEVSLIGTTPGIEDRAGRPALRRRQATLLGRPTARTIRWLPLAVAAVAAELVLWAAKDELSKGEAVPLLPVRVAAVLLCLGAAFLLDDDAGATIEPVVPTLLFRRGLRLMLGLPMVAMPWGAALWIASTLAASGTGPSAHRSLPAAALTLEAAALLAVTLAAAAVATRTQGHGKGGTAAGPALLAFVMGVAAIGKYWPMFQGSPAEPGWAAAHVRWAAILAAAVIVLIVASLDPASQTKFIRGDRGLRRRAFGPQPAGDCAGGKP